MYAKNNEFLFKDPKCLIRFFERMDKAKTYPIRFVTIKFTARMLGSTMIKMAFRTWCKRPLTSELKHLKLSFLDDPGKGAILRYMGLEFIEAKRRQTLGSLRGLETFEIKDVAWDDEVLKLSDDELSPDDLRAFEVRLRYLLTLRRVEIS